jgi:hypothetical protein
MVVKVEILQVNEGVVKMVYCYRKGRNEEGKNATRRRRTQQGISDTKTGSSDADAKTALFCANARAPPEHATP